VLDRSQVLEIEERAQRQVDEAVVEVLASPPPSVDEIDRDVYATTEGR
jgi:TPP-dependent pyruvate/acetoin dehydrogenase alpha subunit